MTIEHWAPPCQQRSPWDTVYLDDAELPGIAEVTVGLGNDIDKGKPAGGSLGPITFRGQKHPDVQISLRIDTEEELAAFERVRTMLWEPPKNAKAQPRRIRHPNTAAWGISVITIEGISSPAANAQDGWTVKITACQWAKGAKATKKASSPGKGGSDMSMGDSAYRLAKDGILMQSIASDSPEQLPGAGATYF